MKRLLIILMIILMPIVTAAYWDSSMGYYGQNQYYYVVFDQESEAAVAARLEIQNTENLTSLDFMIPGENVEIINIVQEYYEYSKDCIMWDELGCDSDELACSKVCSEYSEYKIYPPKYAQVDYTTKQNVESLDVNLEIPEWDQTDIYIIIYYKSNDYVKENMGLYKYNFETIMNEYDTSNVRVSVDVAEDMYMKGISSAIDYRTEMSSAKTMDVAMIAPNIAYVETGYTETASGLDPYESFTVEGKYANSWLRMNWWILLIGTLLIIGAIIGGIYGIRKINKKDKKLGLSLLVGLGTGIVLWAVLGVCVYLLTQLSTMYYMGAVSIIIVMMAVLLGLVLLIAPSVLIGMKYGLNNGIYCFLIIIGTMFVLMAISLAIALAFFPASSPIVYY